MENHPDDTSSGRPRMTWFFLALRIVLGLVFIYAGWVKSMASDQFLYALIPFTFLPIETLPWIARILPILEIVAGLLVLIGWRRIGGGLILILCLIFISVLGWALMNGIIVACACFGQDETPSAGKMLIALGRDVLLATGALIFIFAREIRSRFKTARRTAS
jgi:putative oxidoreductase